MRKVYRLIRQLGVTSKYNVEHDIRTVINVCWESNKEAMNEIAGYPLRYKPTNSEFIDMMAYYLMQTEIETSYPDRKLYTDYSIVKSI